MLDTVTFSGAGRPWPAPGAFMVREVCPLAGVLRTLYGLVMACWLGAMAYFSAILTPTLLRAFPDRFGEIVAALFPGYFGLGEVLAGIAVLAAASEWLLFRRSAARTGVGWRVLVAALALAAVTYNAEILLPQAHAARGTADFHRLHGLSMTLNLVAAVLALIGAVITLARTGPADPRRS